MERTFLIKLTFFMLIFLLFASFIYADYGNGIYYYEFEDDLLDTGSLDNGGDLTSEGVMYYGAGIVSSVSYSANDGNTLSNLTMNGMGAVRTVSFWFKKNANTTVDNYIFNIYLDADNRLDYYIWNDGDFYILAEFNDVQHCNSHIGNQINDGAWHQITSVFNQSGTDLVFYVDGNEECRVVTTDIMTDTWDVYVAGFNTGQDTGGFFDNIYFSDHSFTSQEVNDSYNSGNGVIFGISAPTLGSINWSTLNVTSTGTINSTAYQTSQSGTVYITDSTFTITFTTDKSCNSSIQTTDVNFTISINNDSAFQCATTDTTSHTCTMPSNYLESHGDYFYISLTNDGLENISSSSGALYIDLNQIPVINLDYPTDDSTSMDTTIEFNFTGTDLDNDLLNYTLYLSTNLSNLSVSEVAYLLNKDNGTQQSYEDTILRTNGTILYWKVKVNDSYSGTINSSVYNVTIDTGLQIFRASEFIQGLAAFSMNDEGNWYFPFGLVIGFNNTGTDVLQNYTYNFSALLPNAENITVYRVNDSDPAPYWIDDIHGEFTSHNLSPGCTRYVIRFNLSGLNSSGFNFSCEGDDFGGNCTTLIDVTNQTLGKLTNFTLFIANSHMPSWSSRTSIDLQWKNITAQNTSTFDGYLDENCGDVNAADAPGGGGGFGIHGEGAGEDEGNASDFVRTAITSSDFSFNPTVSADSSGITIQGLDIGGTFRFYIFYSYTEGLTGTSGIGGGGGGSAALEPLIIGNITINPAKIDIPVFLFPFGKNYGEIVFDSSVPPDFCGFEDPHPSLTCFIDVDKGTVTVKYTPQKNQFSDLVQTRLIIKSGTVAQAFVPVSFRLFNFDWYYETRVLPIRGNELLTASNPAGEVIGIKIFPVILIMVGIGYLVYRLKKKK